MCVFLFVFNVSLFVCLLILVPVNDLTDQFASMTYSFYVVCLLSVVCSLVVSSQEGPFVYMSLVGTVETSEGPLAELCEFLCLYFCYFLLLFLYLIYCIKKEHVYFYCNSFICVSELHLILHTSYFKSVLSFQ